MTTTLTAAATDAITTMERGLTGIGSGTDWNSATPDQLWIKWGRDPLNTHVVIDTTTGEVLAVNGVRDMEVTYALAVLKIIDQAKLDALRAAQKTSR